MKRILVAYVTKTGSTAEVATEIGKDLDAKGWAVDIKTMAEISDLGGYSAVILGAPINGMQWHAEALAFVAAHRAALSAMPAACFYLSYIAFAGGREMWKKAIRKSMDRIGTSLNAVSVGAFGGRLAEPLPAPMRVIFGTGKDQPLDKRDWDAIRVWASDVSALLGA